MKMRSVARPVCPLSPGPPLPLPPARGGIEVLEVGVEGFHPIVVGQADIIAIAAAAAGSEDHAIHCCQDRRPLPAGQIHPAVKILLIRIQGVRSPAVS